MKKPTSKDVARLAGVSQSTVSFVMNNRADITIAQETQKKVLEAAKALHYSLPGLEKSIKSGKKVIGVIIPNISNPYYHMLAQSIESNAVAKGYAVFICNTNRRVENEKLYLALLEERKVDAVIFGFTPGQYTVLLETAQRVPVVIIGEKDEAVPLNTISLSSFKAGELVTQHLIDLGHTRFAYVTSPLDKFSLSRQKRLNGILAKLKDYHLDQNLVIETVTDEYESEDSAFEMDIGSKLTGRIVRDHAATAIIGVNDMVALGVLNALSEMRQSIPADYSVCGFDNIYLSKTMRPALTTVDHLVQHRCRMAVDMIAEQNSQSANDIYKIEYEPRLVVRGTTGPVRVI